MKYTISDLYIGFSFRTGELLPLLKEGEKCPDGLFGYNQSYKDLYNDNYHYVNDAGIDKSNCSSLFCVKPFSEYTKITGNISKRNALKVFNQIVPMYLKEQYVRNKIIEVKQSCQMSANAITKENNENMKDLLKEYLIIVNNLDKISLYFELNQDSKGLKR